MQTRLKLVPPVELPHHTEVLISCKPGRSVHNFRMPYAITQPADNSWCYSEDGLPIGSSLEQPVSETHYTPVRNFSEEPCTLYSERKSPNWDMFPVISVKRGEKMFQADPQLTDWDSGGEEFCDVHTTSTLYGHTYQSK